MRSRALRGALTTVAAACAIAAAAPAAATAGIRPGSPGYLAASHLGSEAYVYGVPLLNMEKTYETQTSVSVPDGRGNGPVNHFSHLRALADPLDRTVVAPNDDTLYSIAWIDLSDGPMVVHTPKADRFHVLPLYDPYEENIANIGSAPSALPDGDYVITPPGWHGHIPAGLHRIRAPYDRLWAIGRIVIFDDADARNVNALQDKYSLTPLRDWGRRKRARHERRRAGARDTTVDQATIPGLGAHDDPLAFYDALGDALEQFPPPARDERLLARLAKVGIGPGLHPSREGLSAATLRGLRDGIAQGRSQVDGTLKLMYLESFPFHNGWLVTGTGHYGTDYAKRAVVDKIGLGALTSDIAVYPVGAKDMTAQDLTGAKRYVMHFPAGSAKPPADAFWSLTMYDAGMFFVPNAIDRYVLNDRSGLRTNADGSLDIYLQHDRPSDPDQVRNWLPAPEGAFKVILRLYQVPRDQLSGLLDGSGWKPAPIAPCLPTGQTVTGVACAR
jgi:hypothetical protein